MASAEELMDLLSREEELDPELRDWMFDEPPFGPSLKHPLVYQIMFDPSRSGMVNPQLRYKKEALRRAKATEDWHSYVYLHERPWRLDAFREISWKLDGEDYWKLLGSVWVDSENIYQNREEWRDMLTADPEGREHMSSEDDRQVFTLTPEDGGLLPETVVYRGFQYEDGLDGFSWTLDKARARWFATRFSHRGEAAWVAEGRLPREHVIAYITSRDEQELVALPEHVTVVGVEDVAK